MTRYRKINDEVYYGAEGIVSVGVDDLDFLKARAAENSRKRVRFCTHVTPDALIHEMFIVHGHDAYVRPHKHLDRMESFEVLEGEVDIVFFDDKGKVTGECALGSAVSGKKFYCRIPKGVFHTLKIRSEWLCFKEVTSGPFVKDASIAAEWSPADADLAGVEAFLRKLHGAG